MASVGHALVHTPQAMHLKGLFTPWAVRIESVGHTATHIKHPMHRDLFNITTPCGLTVKAKVGHAATQVWHWLQTFMCGGVASVMTMQDFTGLSSLK